MKRRYLFICTILLSACRPAFDYVAITDAGTYGPEKAFLESFFGGTEGSETSVPESLGLRLFTQTPPSGEGKTKKAPPPALFIEFFSSWEFENAFGDILISRNPLVPRADVLEGRTNTSLEACLENRETFIPPAELGPPFVALRVDGRPLGDEEYPLIRAVGIRIRGEEGKQLKPWLAEKLRLLEESLKAAANPLIRDPPPPVWIAAGGDLMLDRGASDILFKEGPRGIFGGTAEMLARADLSLVNLEGVVSSRGERVTKSFNFRFVPEVAPALRKAGIDAVLHANNHVYDYGGDAFLDSLSWLEKAGLGIAGAGINDEAASEPAVFQRGGAAFRVFGIASFPRERNGWDGVSAAAGPRQPGMLHARRGGREKLKEKFAAGEGSPIDILLFHGGVEWSTRPDESTRELYTDLIRAGADLVIGSHPHVVQGFEWVLGKPVFWSLGNYVFGGMENTEGGEEGLFIRLGFWGTTLAYLEPFALSLSHTKTEIAPPEKLETFYARSRELRKKDPP